jgi:hypothetical protein
MVSRFAPDLHKEALEAEGVGQKPQPQMMAVQTVQLGPHHAQVTGAVGHFEAHDALDRPGSRCGHA